MCRIAVIDDGICKRMEPDLKFDLEISDDLHVHKCNNDLIEPDSHGTVCALIIKKYAPSSEIGSIKILDSDTKTGYVSKMKCAIDWCIRNNVSLINLSLGSKKSADHAFLKQCIDNACKHNILIVAATANQSFVSYPAFFQEVIGIKTDPLLERDQYYICPPNIEGVDICASSKHEIGFETQVCNSFAAPLVTAIVHKLIIQEGCTSIHHIKNTLNKYSDKPQEDYSPDILYTLDNILENLTMPEHINNDLPCIVILHEAYKAKGCVQKLNTLLIKEGYNTVWISTNQDELLSNIISPDKLCDPNIAYIASKYEADVIIVEICRDDMKTTFNISCDILFAESTFENPENAIACEKKISVRKMKADRLYKQMIEVLS